MRRMMYSHRTSCELYLSVGVRTVLQIERERRGEAIRDVNLYRRIVNRLYVSTGYRQFERTWTSTAIHHRDFLALRYSIFRRGEGCGGNRTPQNTNGSVHNEQL